jgi:hypothetical protein
MSAARPRGRVMLVLSCAGAYVSGAAGSNDCPAGSARIETEAACRTAAAAAGKTPHPSGFVWTESTYPRGCFYDTTYNYAYFNTHAVGAGLSGSQLMCAAVTTGAPLHAPTRRRVCCAVLTGDSQGYSKGTHGVLNGQSKGTQRGTQEALKGHSKITQGRVLKGHSKITQKGTQRTLKVLKMH